MSTKYFDLAHLFQQAFGYRSGAFEPQLEPAMGNTDPYRTLSGAYGSPYYGQDAVNREYYLPVTIAYQDNERLTEWNLPYPVISITSKKTIVETPLTQRRGTVKEIINTEDYLIVVKGFIVGAGNELPEQQISILRTIYESSKPISVKSALTDIFLLRPERSGSDEVVVKELKFPAIAGVKNVRPYELHLLSDEPFNLLSID